ncbi:pyocin knob domain-containing protein [Paenibacillus sp. 11B]|uniref:pyocin knob domain-containing protein n=1 Tax=unclassified Paenibacillus TaxID=185978 RepID=UPI00265301BB|nr:pyocin knob domain-containing protein [Paenibacillus sp. 11B]MDN8592013.1 pyocin knob domain-containing protein [Paenibacillus sp. 11B]
MAKTDWTMEDEVKPSDMNQIGAEINSKQSAIKLANNFAAPGAAITVYPEGISVFYVGGGTGGQGSAWRTATGANESFGYVETVRIGTGGYQTFTEMYSGTDPANQAYNKQYKRNKRDSNATWQPFERVLDLDDYDSLVTYADSGFIKKSIVIPFGSDLNTYMEEGNYYCPANATVATLLNSPTAEAFHLTVEPHAGVLQTLTTFQPGNLEVFQRNYYFGWGPWKKVPTREELEEIKQSSVDAKQEAINAALENDEKVVLPLANENAQGYANAAVSPIIGADSPNLVRNSSAFYGLEGWVNIRGFNVNNGNNVRELKFFQALDQLEAGGYAFLESSVVIPVIPSTTYRLQGVFYNIGMTSGSLYIEVYNFGNGSVIGNVVANLNSDWHRKSGLISIPAGVAGVGVRLVFGNTTTGTVPGSVKAITRVKLSYGSADVPYSSEADDLALYEYTERQNIWGAL